MKMNALGLDRVSVFQTAYRTLSIKSAAESLHLTVSAVSQSLMKLEEGLATQLFVRKGKHLLPTEKAKVLYRQSLQFSNSVDELFPDPRALGKLSGIIRIGAPPMFGSGPLLEAIETFRAREPQVSLAISLMSTNRVLDDLRAGTIDLGFIDFFPASHRSKDILTEVIMEEELVLCGHKKLIPPPLRTKKSSLNDLTQLPHVLYHSGFEGTRKWYQFQFKKIPEFISNIAIDHVPGATRAILRGWGVGIVPRHFVENEIRKKTLVVLHGPKGPYLNRVSIAQLKGRMPSLLEREFLASVQLAMKTVAKD